MSAPTISNTLGSLLIGNSIGALLFGIVSIQVYYYFEHHPGDRPSIKWAAGIVGLIDLIHTLFTLQLLYYEGITKFQEPVSDVLSGKYPWSLPGAVLLGSLFDALVQFMFSMRLKYLADNWTLPIICFLLNAARTVTIVILIIFVAQSNLQNFFTQQKGLIYSSLTCKSITDLIIGISFYYYALKSEGYPRFGVRRHVLLLVESGLLSAFVGIWSLAAAAHTLANFIWLSISIVVPKVHAICLLTALNCRHLWRTPMRFFESENPLRQLSRKGPKLGDIRIEMANISTTSGNNNDYQEHAPNLSQPTNGILVIDNKESFRGFSHLEEAHILPIRNERGGKQDIMGNIRTV